MAKPFVSVLIDTYNHERFIEEAIVRVLEQNFPASEMEVLVVDDGRQFQTTVKTASWKWEHAFASHPPMGFP